jgi:ABC-type glutathione transport system ATPase component
MKNEWRGDDSAVSPLLEVRGLSHSYQPRRGSQANADEAVSLHEMNLEVRAGTSLAVVGGSGAGKSTLARCIARIEKPSSGQIIFDGKNIDELHGLDLQTFYREVQMIYQDAATAINPRFSAWEVVAEPLEIQGKVARKERFELARLAMGQMGLPEDLAMRKPLELSGGQLQRLALARALILRPRLLILDEALAGLDLLVQKTIVELLAKLRRERGLTYIFITHDLALAEEVADEIAVMHEGKIVERLSAGRLFTNPRHSYTRRLLQSSWLLKSAREAEVAEVER